MLKKLNNIRAIAFDADDTLWDCQTNFERVEHDYCRLLADFGTAQHISDTLFEVEIRNMSDLGYGAKAFTLSMVENAVAVSGGRVPADTIARIVSLGRTLLHLKAEPLPGVAEILARLRGQGQYKLAVFTKGELLDQENKLRRSGLTDCFDLVSIVSDKTEQAYRTLCHRLAVKPHELVMVGNSFRSDIAPALAIGAKAIHIPYHVTWKHEHATQYEHENLRTIEAFDRLISLV